MCAEIRNLPPDPRHPPHPWAAGPPTAPNAPCRSLNATPPAMRVRVPRLRASVQFAAGGKRTAQLRVLALAALAAAREAAHPAAAAAARAAGLAASSAYTHPLADVQQTKHILGPAAYAALALELEGGAGGDAEVNRAVERAPEAVRELLLQMPARSTGKSRLDRLMFQLDQGIRGRTLAAGIPDAPRAVAYPQGKGTCRCLPACGPLRLSSNQQHPSGMAGALFYKRSRFLIDLQ